MLIKKLKRTLFLQIEIMKAIRLVKVLPFCVVYQYKLSINLNLKINKRQNENIKYIHKEKKKKEKDKPLWFFWCLE